MCKLFTIVLLVFIALSGTCYAQKDSQKVSTKLPAIIDKNGDTIAIYTLEDTKINGTIDATTLENKKAWERLYNNVYYLMPYAITCANKMKELDNEMAKMDKRKDRKRYLKEQREKLSKDYKAKLEDLSEYQGKLLIKLIYRQTGRTTYDLIKEYESGLTAGFWQTLSKLDGMNLKDTYDSKQETLIETAIKICGY